MNFNYICNEHAFDNMEESVIIDEIIDEIDRSCVEIQKKEDIIKINRADKFLVGVMKGNCMFCLKISLKILKSNRDPEIKEFAARLLYNSLNSLIKNVDFQSVVWDFVDQILKMIVLSKNSNLSQKLSNILCYLILFSETFTKPNSIKHILEILIKLSLENSIDPDPACVCFFTSIADEYNNNFLNKIAISEIDAKLNKITREVQIHAQKVLNLSGKTDLKISCLKCIENWLYKIIMYKNINYSLLVKIFDLLLDENFSAYAYNVIVILMNQKYSFEFIEMISGLISKIVFMIFPYLTSVETNYLCELVCNREIQRNVFTLYITFSNVFLPLINDESYLNKRIFTNAINIMFRLTSVSSCFVAPYVQNPDLMVYPYHFWNDFFGNDIIKTSLKNYKFYNVFIELFYIFIQKITLFPWVIENPTMHENVYEIRKEVGGIFKKMSLILPDAFLDNLYITYKIFEQQSVANISKIYLFESATFALSAVINNYTTNHETLKLLQDIYGTIPTLCNTNIKFLMPILNLLSHSAKFLTVQFLPVFNFIIDYLTLLLMNSQALSSPQSKEIVFSCVEFTAKVMEQTDIYIKPEFSNKLIKVFGDLFMIIFINVKKGYNFDTYLSSRNKKAYILTIKIVMRAISCQFLDGSLNEAELYVSSLVREILDLFQACVNKMVANPSPLIYKDIFLLIQILSEISKGLLVNSSSGKGALKIIFERFFSNSLIINTFNIVANSEIAIKHLIDFLDKCFYQGFGFIVNKICIDNFINYTLSLIYSNQWHLTQLASSYIRVLRSESNTLIEPLNFVINPIIQEGFKNLVNPHWNQSVYFFDFLIQCFTDLPHNFMFYNYIPLENAHFLTLKLLEYSCIESMPEVAKAATRCLKRVIACSYLTSDSNILLNAKFDENLNIIMIDYIFNFILDKMLTDGKTKVILYYSVLMEIASHSNSDFTKGFYNSLFSDVVPESKVDIESKRVFYVQYIDTVQDKEKGLDLMIDFFSSINYRIDS